MIYLNLGRREMGKTTLAAYLVHRIPRRIVFDPRGLFPSSSRVTDDEGVKQAFDQLYDTSEGVIVVTPDRDVRASFNYVSREVRHMIANRPGTLAFVVDEARFVDTEKTLDFDWILRCAARDRVQIILTAHRPVDISTDLRAISDMWLIFHMTQEHDLKIIAERCSPEVAESVQMLKPREFIAWDESAGKMKAFRDPHLWYMPLTVQSSSIPLSRAIDELGGSEDLPGKPKQILLP